MPFPTRRSDDADVIRARLRVLLAQAEGPGGWVPDDDPEDPYDPDDVAAGPGSRPGARPSRPGEQEECPPGVGRHRSPGPTTRWDAGRLGARSLWLAGAAAALVLLVWTWLDRPHVEPAPASPAGTAALDSSAHPSPAVGEVAQTSTTVVVSVVGQVARPGVVTLPSGARVADAVDAAGGFLPEADPASVNLAAIVVDGQQIAVGVPGAPVDGGTGAPPGASRGLVDLNTATAAELDALPGIGPVLAQRIVEYRSTQGAFRSVDELDDVPGIGPTIAAELAALVSV